MYKQNENKIEALKKWLLENDKVAQEQGWYNFTFTQISVALIASNYQDEMNHSCFIYRVTAAGEGYMIELVAGEDADLAFKKGA